MSITYPVPAQTSSVFVVVTDRTPTDLSSIVPWRMGPSHRRAARDALGTPRLRLEAFRAARSPWRRMDLSADDLKQVRRSRYHVVVTSTAPVEEQPEAAQVARAAARGIAQAYHGTLYDPLTGARVYHCAECPGERPDFHLGDDWLGWRLSCADEEHTCDLGHAVAETGAASANVDTGAMPTGAGAPVVPVDAGACAMSVASGACAVPIAIPTSAGAGAVRTNVGAAMPADADAAYGGCSCLITTSRGLRRFGLPEIVLTGLACAHSLCAVTALRTVAESLLAGHFAWLSTGPRPLRRRIARRFRVAGMEYAVLSGGADLDHGPIRLAAGEHGHATGIPARSGERFEAGWTNPLAVLRGIERRREDRDPGRKDRDSANAEPVSGTSQEESGLLRVRLTPDTAAHACLKLGLPGGRDGARHPHHAPTLLVA